jgi:hypothetical protein
VRRLVVLCVFGFTQLAFAEPVSDRCAFPPGLGEQISAKYPGARLTYIADLTQYDRGLFQKDHGTRCPGLARVDFYGDGRPTWALALIAVDGSKKTAQLVAARQLGKTWQTKVLDTAWAAAPVVWREAPGKYRDVYGEKTIRATHQTIVFGEYESWAILYAWTGKEVTKIWISD